jgi:hypothetical protein
VLKTTLPRHSRLTYNQSERQFQIHQLKLTKMTGLTASKAYLKRLIKGRYGGAPSKFAL